MINVLFEFGDTYNFKITGHANSGPYGQDLVCAAASGIVSGMLNVLEKRYGSDVEIIISDNCIIINMMNYSNEAIKLDFETLLIQLKTLEEQYPTNIKIKEVH